jgi:translocation and assembly module TamB
MHRFAKVALGILGIVVALPIVLVVLILIAGNLAPVQRLIERETSILTGGMVHIAGLHGTFPDALRLTHLDIADSKGPWLSADNIALDWSAGSLITLAARVDTASIGHLSVLRRPIPARPQTSTGNSNLPVSIDVRDFRIARADIAAPVAGTAFSAALQATAHINTLTDGAASLTVSRLDSPGTYHVDGTITQAAAAAHMSLQEPAGGLLAAVANLPDLGPIAITADLDGPKSAEQAHLNAAIGAVRATLTGTTNLPARTLALNVVATAPAMHPRADLSWRNIDLHAHIAGPFAGPDATGHLTLANVQSASLGLQNLQADLSGNKSRVTLNAVLTGLRIPGKKPDLFANAPFKLDAAIDLIAAGRPATLHLTHPLLAASATAQTAGQITAQLHAVLPDLGPLSAASGTDIRGHADIVANASTSGADKNITATGTVTIDGGATPPPGLLGNTSLDIAATLHGRDIDVRHATLDGKNLHLSVSGTDSAENIAANFTASAPNLDAFSPQAEGAITATGQVDGPPQNLKITADINGDAGSPKYGKGPVSVTLVAAQIPAAPNAEVNARLFLAGATAELAATANTDYAGTIHAVISHADWKSFKLRADIATPKSGIPAGKLDLTAGSLADFSALAGQPLGGRLHASLTTTETNAAIKLDAQNLAAGARHIAALALTGRATGVQSDPDLNAALTLNGIDAQQIAGDARITAEGRATSLHLAAQANLQNLQGAPATLATTALLNARTRQAILQSLTANWKDLLLRLQGTSTFNFANRIAVNRLRLALNDATLDIAGQFGPALDLTASLKNVTPDLAKSFAPGLNARGTLAADAHLTGAPSTPAGTLHLRATGLRGNTGPAASLPAATLAANANFANGAASVNASLNAGPKLHLSAICTVPLRAQGAIAAHATGSFDLTLLNPILQADGRQAKGTAALDLTATGTPQLPAINGSVTLAHADIQDFTQGLHLERITGRIDATGNTLTIANLSAGAGPGTLSVSGTLGLTQPGLPIDLRLTARNARPLSSDLLTTNFDADLQLRGQAAARMDATGSIKLHRMDINIPDSLPPSVATLNVRRPGQKPAARPTGPAPPPSSVHLAIDVDAPSSIFVRGKGLNAEMAGKLTIRGTSTTPLVDGGFTLRRGDFSLAGTDLNFTKGDVTFNGSGLTGGIDPSLDFEADTYSGNITATLQITGYADAPKIALSSIPDLPQDEVLAHLLFGQSMSQLSPLQIAEIGAALADIAGLTGSGEGPLGAIRKNLGLDRLSVGGGTGGAGTSVEAGRYVAKGVYVGTKQSTSGAGTQAQVQIGLTRRLKLNTTLGTGGGSAQGATPDNDPGSSIGLSYGFEY